MAWLKVKGATPDPDFTEAVGPFKNRKDAQKYAEEAKIEGAAEIKDRKPRGKIDRWWKPEDPED